MTRARHDVRRAAIDGTTLGAESEPQSRRARHDATVTVLVIVWSAAEPQRVGQLAIVPASGAPQTLGRGEGEGDGPRVRFFRQRPGVLEATPPLASPRLSRRQLEVQPIDGGAEIESVGNCAMLVNGASQKRATIQPGDTVYFRGELLLLCTRRSARVPKLRYFPSDAVRAFGEPDATGVLGETPATWTLRERIAFAAKTDHHVLLLGESGTGKELAAQAIHRLSAVAAGPLVVRNAATLPAGLIVAELFGNLRNYPNAGMSERAGLIGEADGGSFFLDEIGELPVELQANLLRVLDSHGEYQRLGESTMRRSRFRLIGATNRTPDALKHDFLARFTTRVEIPPLSARREDIPLLVRHLVLRAAKKNPELAGPFVARTDDGFEYPRVSAKLIERLITRAYTTHARELDTILWQSMAESEGDTLVVPRDMPDAAEPGVRPPTSDEAPPREPTIEEVRAALETASNSVTRAARALGLSSRYTLYRLIKKYGIVLENESTDD